MLQIIVSCSAEQRYKYLTIFFDDVEPPDTTSIKIDSSKIAVKNSVDENKTEPKTVQPEVIEIKHPPAEEDGCNNCHIIEKSYTLVEKQPKLCYNCHDDFSKKYKELHGPLLVGACTACHDPHKSANKPLIKAPGQELCFFCHQKQDVLRNDIHSSIEDNKCWDCHNPHGGADRTFMK